MRITKSRETAEEVTVDVFHDVWRRAAGYEPTNGSVLGWIMNQARSRTLDRLRFEQRKKRTNPHAPDADDAVAVAESADVVAEANEQHEKLRAALEVLTPDERLAIDYAFFSEQTHAEVAAKLEQPLGTIKTRIRSALQKLRRALGAEAKQP